jgi:hypothetical protein
MRQSPEAERIAAMVVQAQTEAARGRARTARLLRAVGPGALQEVLTMAALTGVAALLLIRAF